MADTKISALPAATTLEDADKLALAQTLATTPVTNAPTLSELKNYVHASSSIFNDFRLTLESGEPVSVSDQTAKTTVYLTPYNGSIISLYDGTNWVAHSTVEISIALGTLTSDTNYDVFVYDNAGTVALELSAAWTNDTTRADALTTQDGILVKSGATTRLYVGTFRTTSTTTTEDSAHKRFVWNLYNQVRGTLYRKESTASWTYATATYRIANADSDNQVAFVCGYGGRSSLTVTLRTDSVTNSAYAGIGYDSTSDLDASSQGGWMNGGTNEMTAFASLNKMPATGYHYAAWLERGAGSSATFYGTSGTAYINGLSGTVIY